MSEKNVDAQGRLRSKIISFRMSPEEAEYLDKKVALSGATKQDYIISKVLDRTLVVYGNPYLFKRLYELLMEYFHDFDSVDQMTGLQRDIYYQMMEIFIAMHQEKMTTIENGNHANESN